MTILGDTKHRNVQDACEEAGVNEDITEAILEGSRDRTLDRTSRFVA